METKYCRNCGAQVSPQAKFCRACGTKIIDHVDLVQSEKPELVSTILLPEESQKAGTVEIIPEKKTRQKRRERTATPRSVLPDSDTIGVPRTPKVTAVQRRKVGTVLLAVILCVLIFIWLFAAVAVADIRLSLAPDRVSDTLGTVINYDLVMDLPAHILIPEASGANQTIVEWAVDEIEAAYDGALELSVESVEDFLMDSTFLPFLRDELGDYMTDIVYGGRNSGVTDKELENLLYENARELEAIYGGLYDDAAITKIVEQVSDSGLLDPLSADELRYTSPAVYYGIQLGLSYWTCGLFIFLSVLFVLLLAKCNSWNLWNTFGDIGIVLTVQGGILLITTVFAVFLPDWWGAIFAPVEQIGILIGTILLSGLISTEILLVAGIVLLIIGILGKKIVIRSAQKRI